MNCDSRNIGTPSGRFVRSDGQPRSYGRFGQLAVCKAVCGEGGRALIGCGTVEGAYEPIE